MINFLSDNKIRAYSYIVDPFHNKLRSECESIKILSYIDSGFLPISENCIDIHNNIRTSLNEDAPPYNLGDF